MKRIVQILWILISAAFIAQLTHSIHDLSSRGNVVVETQARLEKAREENKKLKEESSYVESPAFVEQQARDKLNLARKGEVVAIVPQAEPTPTPSVVAENKQNWELWMETFRVNL